jgi:hypothetical protein
MMTTNSNRKLAKGFWPVLLLSAALSLPAASVAAPSPNGRAAAADKQNKDKGRNQVRKELQKNQRQAAKQRTEIRRDAQKQRSEVRRDTQKRQAEVKRESQQRQAELRREADRRRQAEVRYQAQQRQLNLQRQTQRQRQLELQRNIERQRQAEFYRQQQRNRSSNRYNDRYVQNNRYRDDSFYRNRFGRYTYRNNGYQEHLDGFVVDDRGECILFREHRTGQIFALAGNIDDMREGDHIRYVGTHTYDEYCDSGYPTMNVREIKTVWSNDRHEHALFDANRHGSYDRWADHYYGY